MMAGGIVMISIAPVALLIALVASSDKSTCQSGGINYSSTGGLSQGNCSRYNGSIYGGAILGTALLGGGIPLVVIGGKKEPVVTAQLSGWATPRSGGAGLRLVW